MIHLHVRGADGAHLLDAEAYRAAISGVCNAVGDRLVVQITSESQGRYAPGQQMAVVLETNPEAVSLALRELAPEAKDEKLFADFLLRLKRMRIWPQIILYTPEEAVRLADMQKRGVVPFNDIAVLYALGRYTLLRTAAPSRPAAVPRARRAALRALERLRLRPSRSRVRHGGSAARRACARRLREQLRAAERRAGGNQRRARRRGRPGARRPRLRRRDRRGAARGGEADALKAVGLDGRAERRQQVCRQTDMNLCDARRADVRGAEFDRRSTFWLPGRRAPGCFVAARSLDPGREEIPDGSIWIDMIEPTVEEDQKVQQFIGATIPTRSDPDYAEPAEAHYAENGVRYLQASVISEPEDTPDVTDVTFVVAPAALVTVRYHACESFDIFGQKLCKAPAAAPSPDAVAVGLVNTAINRSARALSKAGVSLDQIASRVFRAKDEQGGPQPDLFRHPVGPRPRGREDLQPARKHGFDRAAAAVPVGRATARRQAGQGAEGGARRRPRPRCATCSRSRRTRASRRRRCSSCSTPRSA